MEKCLETIECQTTEKIDPRAKRTLKMLEDAWRALMAERSFPEITVADITDRAGVNRATFYAHYEDKAHLATTILRADLVHALREALGGPCPFQAKNLQKVAIVVFEFFDSLHMPCASDHTVGMTLQKALEDFVLMWLQHAPDAMQAFPGSTPEIASMVIAWSLYGGAIRWSHEADRPSVATAAQSVVSIVLR